MPEVKKAGVKKAAPKKAAPKKEAPKKKLAPKKDVPQKKAQPQKKVVAKKGKKGAAKEAGKTAAIKKVWAKRNPLIESTPRVFRIGQALPPKRDLTRFVRWPWYVRLQREKRVLFRRLKVPPPINQFSAVLNKGSAAQLFGVLNKLRPEEKGQRKKRRLAEAKALVAARAKAKEEKGKEGADKAAKPAAEVTPKPIVVKYGLNHVTSLVERNKAQLVVIASDVDPIELVVWLPALCRKKKVAYCIVKNKARLGRVVHKKTASVLAITQVAKEDRARFTTLVDTCRMEFNENPSVIKMWGGSQLGIKRRQLDGKRRRILEQEESRKKKK